MGISVLSYIQSAGVTGDSRTSGAAKPEWNGNKAYAYLEDYNSAALSYGERAAKYYAARTSQDGELSVDELKAQIKEWFPGYTLTESEPSSVTTGKYYLYIDDSQLQKMAQDAGYRAKVYGLLDREYTCAQTYTLQYSDGRNVTSHCTGSVFSLSEKNKRYAGADGIPYLGSCSTDTPWSASDSHPQVRSMSFLYDHVDPAKSAAKSRSLALSNSTAKKTLEKLREKKKAEKKAAEKKAEKRKSEKMRKERLEDSRRRRQEAMDAVMGSGRETMFDKKEAQRETGSVIDYRG